MMYFYLRKRLTTLAVNYIRKPALLQMFHKVLDTPLNGTYISEEIQKDLQLQYFFKNRLKIQGKTVFYSIQYKNCLKQKLGSP